MQFIKVGFSQQVLTYVDINVLFCNRFIIFLSLLVVKYTVLYPYLFPWVQSYLLHLVQGEKVQSGISMKETLQSCRLRYLKLHEIFPKIKKVAFPPWLHPVKIWLQTVRVLEKSRNFQIVYVGHTNLCKRCTTDHARGIMKLGVSHSPHSPIAELSLPLEVVMISSAWRVQPLLGSSEFT